MQFYRKSFYKNTIQIPGDKSISHRALLFNSLTKGTVRIENLLMGEDVQATIACLRQLGIEIHFKDNICILTGRGGSYLQPEEVLNCENSGTTMRLFLGLLAPHALKVVLSGDESLSTRPMDRVTQYLEPLGVRYEGSRNLAPIYQIGCPSIPWFESDLYIASAQMKSSLLLTGLQSCGCTVRGGKNSRDHTERMLRAMGATVVQSSNGDVTIEPTQLMATDIIVPNDISSASFFIVAALLLPNAEIELPNIGINPTRDGILRVLQIMGADIQIQNRREVGGEPVGDLVVCTSNLTGVEVPIDWVPTMIDEIPILALAASQATGRTVIRGAADLRKKESDRIHAIVCSFREMGIEVEEFEDGLAIEGPQPIVDNHVHCFGDHRITMTAAIAALISFEELVIDSITSVDTSFPTFWMLLEALAAPESA